VRAIASQHDQNGELKRLCFMKCGVHRLATDTPDLDRPAPHLLQHCFQLVFETGFVAAARGVDEHTDA